MFTKQSYESIFESILVNKYCKEFHIIDNPNLMFSLAQKTNYEQISEIKQIFASAQEIRKKFTTTKQKEGVRNFYSNLKNDVSEILKSIYKCFELRKFALSEFFQYEQLVLSGFFQAFVEHLRIQCKEKGQFVEFVWNQNTKIVQKVFENYERLDGEYELQKNTQLRDTHVKYSDFMQKQAEKVREQYLKILNLKNIIEILVEKLRIRRKQVKKLFRETQQLISIVNEFKDKNIELQMKYLNLIQSSATSNEFQLKSIAQKKQRLNYVYRQILTIENSLYKNSRTFQHEVHLEGPLQPEDFIKEASQIIHGSAVSNQQIKAEIDIILDKYEQDFQDVLLRLKKTPKRKALGFQGSEPFCETNVKDQRGLTCYHCNQPLFKPDKTTRSTQITNVDKHCNNLIKSVATMTNLDLQEKPPSRDFGVQYDIPVKPKPKHRPLHIFKTVQVCIKKPKNTHKKSFKGRSLLKNPRSVEKFRASSDQNNQDSFQNGTSSDSSKQSVDVQALLQNRTNKRSVVNMVNIGNKSSKSRFSLIETKPRKASYLHLMQPKMESIQEQRDDQNKKQNHGRNTSAFISSFPARPVKSSKGQSRYEQLPNDSFHQDKNKLKQQSQSNCSQEKLGNQFEHNDIIEYTKKRTASLSRFSRMSKLNSSHKNSISKYQKRSSRTIKENSNNILQDEKNKVDQRRGSNLESKYRLSSNQARSSLVKGKKASKNLRESMRRKIPQKQGVVEFSIKNAFQKAYSNLNGRNGKENKLPEKLIMQLMGEARSKCKEYSLKTRKLSFFIKHNNVINIISSVYARAYQKLNTSGKVFDFIEPLYDSMMVLYGNIPKQEISKKITNFIAQVAYRKKDPFCNSFAFLLGVQQEKSSYELTPFDHHLYLRLINRLSTTENPFQDTQNVATDLKRIKQFLPLTLQQHGIGQNIIKRVVSKIASAIEYESGKIDTFSASRINVFSCCKSILKELIKIKINIKDSFKEFIQNLIEAKTVFNQKHVHKIVQILSVDKIEQVVSMSKILGIPRKNSDSFQMNEFSTSMLMLNIENFQDYCIRMLRKFKIVDEGKRKEIVKYWAIMNGNSKIQTQETIDVLTLKIAQEKSSEVLEELIGNDLTQLFSFSILKVCGI